MALSFYRFFNYTTGELNMNMQPTKKMPVKPYMVLRTLLKSPLNFMKSI